MSGQTVNDKIDFSKSEQYTLSIRLSTDGFSFSIYNPILNNSFCYITKEIKQAFSMAANVREIIRETDFVSYPYKRVNVLLINNRFTLIPFDLFEDEQVDTVFYHNLPPEDNELILYNILRKANVAVAFSLDKSVHQQLTELFPSAHFYSQASSLIEYFIDKSRLGNSNKMYVCVRSSIMDVFCFERGRLIFSNSFECTTTEDRIYYLLYIWKQLDLDQERDELHLAGQLDKKEQLTTELRKYLKRLFIINPKAEFNNSEISRIEDIPFDLQTLCLCEL